MQTTTTRTEAFATPEVRIGDTYRIDTPAWFFFGTVERIEIVETVMVGEGVSAGSKTTFRSVNATVVDEDGSEVVIDAAANNQGTFTR